VLCFLTPVQGLCPWTPLGAEPPHPRYLALRAPHTFNCASPLLKTFRRPWKDIATHLSRSRSKCNTRLIFSCSYPVCFYHIRSYAFIVQDWHLTIMFSLSGEYFRTIRICATLSITFPWLLCFLVNKVPKQKRNNLSVI